MAVGAKFYYTSSDSLGKVAAKTASDSGSWKFTTPKDTFTIHNYYADADANYEYITPRTSTSDYGGWASYDYHAIAQDKFYYKNSSSSAYTSFKFVHKLSAPLLKKTAYSTNWGQCQAQFEYYAMGANYAGFGAKIYWDNSNKKIKVDILDSAGNKLKTELRDGYGVFILLSGAGGGGGGGDQENLFQGKPGGGGGGGGGTALIYFDAKKAYDSYKDCYVLISLGGGGAGGKGGAGFTSGSAGTESEAKLKTSSGTDMYRITCYGGKGGASHAWNAAADSAGGAGGTVDTYLYSGQYNNIMQSLKLLDSAPGGNGGAGKRGSNGNSGSSIAQNTWKMPFNDLWWKRDSFTSDSGSDTCFVGAGTSNNNQGGGGGGCAAGYKNSASPLYQCGKGMGGYGGGAGQAGQSGADGFCGIFYNYIPGVSTDCSAEKIPTNYNVNTSSNIIGLQRVYLSTSSTATSGSSSLTVASGTTVYGYAVLGTDTYTSNINGWTLISGTACKQGAIYRIGSKTITAATTFTIELFSSNTASTVLFTRSGEGVGSWTVSNHVMQSADNYGKFHKSGNSIYVTGTDYDGIDRDILFGSFSCPSGYAVDFTITDSSGASIAWDNWFSYDGPYVLNAETTAESSQT